ncbi:S41 family peptidase [Candidatus Gracilibacteria bacterium]|nr:S41 family peptidase [Candidatus Gracilibacteria bacterium]
MGKSPQEVVSRGNFQIDTTVLNSVYSLIQDNFYTQENIDTQALTEGAVKGMVEMLQDKNSEFMNRETTERFMQSLSGDFEGIGAVVEKVTLGVKVERVIQGSPALLGDIRSGDIIISANGISLEDLDLFDAVEEIKGPAGTEVILEVIRPSQDDVITKNIIRQKIQIPSIEHEIFEDENIGYIRVNMFGDSTSFEFREALGNISTNNPDGLILDLRNNGGGYLESAVEILSEFIVAGEKLVSIRYRDSVHNTQFRSDNNGDIFDKKIVVLINENSASAAEITAGALREYNKAILLGAKSFGKGSVQQPFDISGGGLLKLTVANWYTPLGRNIELEGINPDIEVIFLEEDFENNYDRQLEEAKRLMQIYIEKNTIGLTLEAFEPLISLEREEENLNEIDEIDEEE